MAKLSVAAGTTSLSVFVFLQTTAGAAQTGLVYNSSGLTAYWSRPGSASAAITLATQTTTGAYSSGGFVELDSTHMPGIYRLDIPNTVIASGRSAVVTLQGFSGMQPCNLEIDLENDANVSTVVNAAIDSILQRQLTESYASLHAVPTLTQAVCGILQALNESSISGTTLTVKKVDGSTTAETFTLNSSTTPSAITRAS